MRGKHRFVHSWLLFLATNELTTQIDTDIRLFFLFIDLLDKFGGPVSGHQGKPFVV